MMSLSAEYPQTLASGYLNCTYIYHLFQPYCKYMYFISLELPTCFSVQYYILQIAKLLHTQSESFCTKLRILQV